MSAKNSRNEHGNRNKLTQELTHAALHNLAGASVSKEKDLADGKTNHQAPATRWPGAEAGERDGMAQRSDVTDFQ